MAKNKRRYARFAEVQYRDYPKAYTFRVPKGMKLKVGDYVVMPRCDYSTEVTPLVGQVTRLLPAPLCEGVKEFKLLICKVPMKAYLAAVEAEEVEAAVKAELEDALAEHNKMLEYAKAAKNNHEIADLLDELEDLKG